MLPAIELPLKPGVGHRFTRRPDWVAPCESLWGMLSKWQFVNRLPYTTAAAAIIARPVALTDTGVDLRVISAFDLNALALHSGISAVTLAGGACGCSPDARVLAITSDYLRYCSACMQVGYHAALFQFTVIARCPIHLQRLRGACPHCKRRIPYRFDPSFLAKPFACPYCAHPWLHEPRVLARHHWDAAPMDAILRWQRYLGTFAFWYAEGPPTIAPRHRALHPGAGFAAIDHAGVRLYRAPAAAPVASAAVAACQPR